MGFRIDGKVALVTGAGRDIGAACALELARNGADVLVNNAGGMVKRARLADLTLELLEEVMRLNFTSALLVTKAVLPFMEKQRSGKVINISSVAGSNGGAASTPHYAPAKAALTNLARTLTKDYASKNIQINTVAPGVIDTRFHVDHTSREVWEGLLKAIPMGRAGTSEEVAGTVAFLASPAANYITGEVIHVNGGLHFGQ